MLLFAVFLILETRSSSIGKWRV